MKFTTNSDGNIAALSIGSGVLFYRYTTTGEPSVTFVPNVHQEKIVGLSIVQDGTTTYLVSTGEDKIVRVASFDHPEIIHSQTKLLKKPSTLVTTSIELSHDDGTPFQQHVAILGELSGDVVCLPLPHVHEQSRLLLRHTSSMVLDMAVTPKSETSKSSYLLTADRDEKIRASLLPHCAYIKSYCLGHTSVITRIALIPWEPSLVVSGGADCTIRVWNWQTGTLCAKWNILDSNPPYIHNPPITKVGKPTHRLRPDLIEKAQAQEHSENPQLNDDEDEGDEIINEPETNDEHVARLRALEKAPKHANEATIVTHIVAHTPSKSILVATTDSSYILQYQLQSEGSDQGYKQSTQIRLPVQLDNICAMWIDSHQNDAICVASTDIIKTFKLTEESDSFEEISNGSVMIQSINQYISINSKTILSQGSMLEKQYGGLNQVVIDACLGSHEAARMYRREPRKMRNKASSEIDVTQDSEEKRARRE